MRLVRFSKLVQKSLAGLESSIQSGISDSNILVHAIGALGGTTLKIGPSYESIICPSTANRQWKRAFEGHYHHPDELQSLREENEAHISALINLDSSVLDSFGALNPMELYSMACLMEGKWNGDEHKWDDKTSVPEHTKAVQDIKIDNQVGSKPVLFLGSNLLMGITSSEAKEGDIICNPGERIHAPC
jgi:hypothetical protein